MQRESEVAIRSEGLTKTYRGGVRALDGVSFAVHCGEVFALLGPNGAGKSTAVKILTTLSRPDEGRARVAGFDVVSEPEGVRRSVGVVAQRPSFDRDATGRENLHLQGRVHGLRGRRLRARVDEVLGRYRLGDVADRPARTYSGGMQRRLDVAVALVHEPRVLFLDEPTTGLDPEVRTALWEEIGGLAGREGVAILLTTHYLEEADRLAHTMAIMDKGRVIASAAPEALKARLRGDAVVVELAEPSVDGAERRALDGVAGLSGVAVEGRVLRARTGHGATAIPAVVSALESRGIPVASVTVSRPSLDDVYLHHTGRTLNEAEVGVGGAR